MNIQSDANHDAQIAYLVVVEREYKKKKKRFLKQARMEQAILADIGEKENLKYDVFTKIRLHFDRDNTIHVHYGSKQFDTDHVGSWSSQILTPESDVDSLFSELFHSLIDDIVANENIHLAKLESEVEIALINIRHKIEKLDEAISVFDKMAYDLGIVLDLSTDREMLRVLRESSALTAEKIKEESR